MRLSYADNETDRNVVWDVFVNRCYGNDFHDSTVIDIGAHKGYFGAYALMHGAKQVVSYEPERQNFEFLTQTAQSFGRRAGQWETRRSAVTARSGEVTLRVDPSSWAHSIATEPSDTADSNTQVVAGTAMTEVVASAAERARRGPARDQDRRGGCGVRDRARDFGRILARRRRSVPRVS